MSQRRFHEVTDAVTFEDALARVATDSAELLKAMLHQEVSIDTVCLFAQTSEEYACIRGLVEALGERSERSHTTTLYVDVERDIAGQPVTLVGVRQPDPTRPERGYGDYRAPNFSTILDEVPHVPGLELVTSAGGHELIEATHPDFNVRSYIVGDLDL